MCLRCAVREDDSASVFARTRTAGAGLEGMVCEDPVRSSGVEEIEDVGNLMGVLVQEKSTLLSSMVRTTAGAFLGAASPE